MGIGYRDPVLFLLVLWVSPVMRCRGGRPSPSVSGTQPGGHPERSRGGGTAPVPTLRPMAGWEPPTCSDRWRTWEPWPVPRGLVVTVLIVSRPRAHSLYIMPGTAGDSPHVLSSLYCVARFLGFARNDKRVDTVQGRSKAESALHQCGGRGGVRPLNLPHRITPSSPGTCA